MKKEKLPIFSFTDTPSFASAEQIANSTDNELFSFRDSTAKENSNLIVFQPVFKGENKMKKEKLPIFSFTDTPNLEFKDISMELWREYDFLSEQYGYKYTYTIENPLALHVSKSGGHRIIDGKGVAHYIPFKWVALRWENIPEAPRVGF